MRRDMDRSSERCKREVEQRPFCFSGVLLWVGFGLFALVRFLVRSFLLVCPAVDLCLLAMFHNH